MEIAGPPLASDSEDRNEEDEDVCRICRNSGDSDNPLYYPCACRGSIKFVHEDCLLQWLDRSKNRRCEVCRHMFLFSPIYAEDAPARLPLREFLTVITFKVFDVLQIFLHSAFSFSVYFLLISFGTYWIWQLAFVRSLSEAQKLFSSHISTKTIAINCFHGYLLSGIIKFVFHGFTFLRDFFIHLWDLRRQNLEGENGGRDGVHAARRPPDNADRDFVGGGEGIAGAGQIGRRNAENVAAWLEVLAAQLEDHVGRMFGRPNGVGIIEFFPFDMLVRIRVPVFRLLENSFSVLFRNTIFLIVVIFIPLSLGRVFSLHLLWLFSSATIPALSSVIPPTQTHALANNALNNALGADANSSLESRRDDMQNQVTAVVAGMLKEDSTGLEDVSNIISRTLSANLFKGEIIRTSHLSNEMTLAIGYMFILLFFLFCLGPLFLIHYSRGQRLNWGRLFHFAYIAEAVLSIIRKFCAVLRHFMTMAKVAFILVIKFGFFPLICGCWLDICTLRVFGKTIVQRVAFFLEDPAASSFYHWIAGILYMLQFSFSMNLLQGVLHNGVLNFLQNLADPIYILFHSLVEDPVHKHAGNILLAVGIHGSLVVMLFFLPVRLAVLFVPSLFPLDLSLSDPLTTRFLFHICIPWATRYFKLRATVKTLLCQWFTVVGRELDLTDVLLPRPEGNGMEENADVVPEQQQGQHDRQLHEEVGQRNRDLGALASAEDSNLGIWASGNSDVEEKNGDEQADSEYHFFLRILLLLVLAWITLLLSNLVLIVVPISLGRALFNAIPLLPLTRGIKFPLFSVTLDIKFNDIYAFILGNCIIRTVVTGSRYVVQHVQTGRAGVLLKQIWKWCGIALKSSALLSIWIFVIPVLIGLLFELVVVTPIRVPLDESPVFILYEDWLLGLIFLKFWTSLVLLDDEELFVDRSWRVKFERVLNDGFSQLQGLWVMSEIIIPIMMKLLTALCVPYMFSRGLFPMLGYPLLVNSAVHRFAWVGCLASIFMCSCAKRIHALFIRMHNAIWNERYLIGQRLHNFKEVSGRDAKQG